jgi:hypothetical protein
MDYQQTGLRLTLKRENNTRLWGVTNPHFRHTIQRATGVYHRASVVSAVYK